MKVEYKLKDYYNKFISDSKKDIRSYNELLKELSALRDGLYTSISNNKKQILDILHIDITKYIEFTDKSYDETDKLRTIVINKLKSNSKKEEVNKLLFILNKYIKLIKEINLLDECIRSCTNRLNISFIEYRNIVSNYYNAAHKEIIQGNAYTYGGGVGTIVVNRWTLQKDKLKYNKRILNYAETNKRKKELLAQGKKIYDKNEAIWYAARNIPYDGIDYKVYNDNTSFYEIVLTNSQHIDNKAIEFKHTEYINKKHRSKTFVDMSNECLNIDEIANYQVDIRYKLNMYLAKYPEKYVNFIRNETKNKQDYRGFNI